MLRTMPRERKLPKRLQLMLATLAYAPFDDRPGCWRANGMALRMVASIEARRVTLYSRNGKIISDSYQHARPKTIRRRGMAIPAGLEPATPCLEGRCSIRLSYGISATGKCEPDRRGSSEKGRTASCRSARLHISP